MAALTIPGQPQRWGNESSNFYYASFAPTPGVASRQKEYRCPDSQYTNPGHYHNGTKALNLNPPLDKYGTPSAYKLRASDQLIPKALSTSTVQCPMPTNPTINLYQSHRQKYCTHAMATPNFQHLPSESPGGDQAVARSLNKAFYTTSYQSHIDKYAAQRSRPNTASSTASSALSSTPSLCDNLNSRHARTRVKSAPPIRVATVVPAPPLQPPPAVLSRRRSFTDPTHSYPTRSEMLKSIFEAFPAPQPQAASRRAGLPSCGVTLRAGKIPFLRK